MRRRAFLQRTGLTLAAASAVSPAGAADAPAPSPMIDTHQHLWDISKFRMAWLANAETLNHSFLPADYRKAAAGTGVVKSIYMEVDVDPSQHVAEAEYVSELCRHGESPLVAAVIGGRPASEGFAAYLDKLLPSPYIKGVRQVLHGGGTPPGYCLDPAFIRGIRALGKRGLSFDLCTRPAELPDCAKLAETCPETRFVLDHCGNANVRWGDAERDGWKRDMELVAGCKNVSAKVSGIIASARGGAWKPADLAPIVDHVLDSFGPDRVVFGGDWPVCTLGAPLGEWVGALRTIVSGRPAIEQRKLFHDNALRVYRLEAV